MKNLVIINGTMGVGKTTISQCLKKILPNAVFLDGDWCWDSDPFIVNERTKTMVMENIAFLLNQFLSCSDYENVICCWVIPDQVIMDDLLSRLNIQNANVYKFSLMADEATLRAHLEGDIQCGVRELDVIERSLAYQERYLLQQTIKINVNQKQPSEIVKEIQQFIGGEKNVSSDCQ